jgi:hypothetical protein
MLPLVLFSLLIALEDPPRRGRPRKEGRSGAFASPDGYRSGSPNPLLILPFTGRKADIQISLNKMGQKIIFSKTFGIHVSVLLGCFFVSASSCKRVESDTEKENLPKYLEQVSYLNVRINDNFWRPKFESNRENGIPSVFEAGKTSVENFDIAAGKTEGEQNQRMASDYDVYKIVQGVAYSLQHTPDKELEAFTDSLIDRIVAAQQDDG